MPQIQRDNFKGDKNAGKLAAFGARFLLPELAQNAPSGLSMIENTKSPMANPQLMKAKKSLKAVESLN